MSDFALPEGDDPRRRQSTLALSDITMEALRAGDVSPEDVTIRRSTLEAQASQAMAEGYPQLARNFLRAAELTAVPGPMLLEIYEKLRPKRARYDELLSLSQEIIARFDAPETGAYIREAAEAYRLKSLLHDP